MAARIELAHINVADGDFAGVSHGWEKYYWTPLRSYLSAGRGPDSNRGRRVSTLESRCMRSIYESLLLAVLSTGIRIYPWCKITICPIRERELLANCS